MRYIIFTRVSTDKQKVENQIDECRKFIDNLKEPSDKVFEFAEPDTSSRIKAEDRQVLQEMMQFTKKGDTLIIYKLDRLARNSREMVNIYGDLIDKGVKIHSLYEPNADEKYVSLYGFVAMTERESIQQRTITALNRKKANLEKVGTAWYGYAVDETKLSPYKGSKSEGKPYLLVPNQAEQEAIKLMLQCRQSQMSYEEIAQTLNSHGHRNRAGEPFARMSVYRVLKRLETSIQPSPHLHTEESGCRLLAV